MKMNFFVMITTVLCICCLSACGTDPATKNDSDSMMDTESTAADTDTDSDTDTDVDTDTDTDMDSDTDSDTDTDTDSDTDTDTDTDADTDTALYPDCPKYVTSLANCPHQVVNSQDGCDAIQCLENPCTTDTDCPEGGGTYCVTGNCVKCQTDADCGDSMQCQGGRCLVPDPSECPTAPSCTEEGCDLISISEDPCPVCVCPTIFSYTIPCETDVDCMSISSRPLSDCINHRCVECRNDDDCGSAGPCIQPGICWWPDPPAHTLYGTWLVGWSGGMNHFSYFRFEPDGTVRRADYGESGGWSDDIPPLPCFSDDNQDYPLLGIWTPVLNEAGFLVFDIFVNVSCDNEDGFSSSWVFKDLSEDGQTAIIQDESLTSYHAERVDIGTCSPDFRSCDSPL